MAIAALRPTRHLDLQGPIEVVDLGGHQGRAGQTIRWHRLYRSGDLSRATESDRARLAALGVATVVDLRTDRELAAARLPVLRGSTVEIHHLPMVRDGWEAAAPVRVLAGSGGDDGHVPRSLDMLVEGAPAIADALRILAQPHAQPAVLMSSDGAVRARLLAAVILALLGVPAATIAELDAPRAVAREVAEQGRVAVGSGVPGARSGDAPVRVIAPGSMVRVLDQVSERCGSMVGFARGIGVEFEVIEALHRQLLT